MRVSKIKTIELCFKDDIQPTVSAGEQGDILKIRIHNNSFRDIQLHNSGIEEIVISDFIILTSAVLGKLIQQLSYRQADHFG